MLATGSAILAAALVLLALALRGRVVARGRFCRRCRFDLAGLTDPAACPECGRDLDAPRASRAILRRRPRSALVVAFLAALLGAGVLGIAASGRAGAVVRSLPDGPVVTLAGIGLDEAVTELAARSGAVPAMDARHLRRAASAGIKRQRAAAWDRRWGTVLANAHQAGAMTADQRRAYLTNGVTLGATIRDRTAHGDGSLAYRIELDLSRLATDMQNSTNVNSPVHLEVIEAGWTQHPGLGYRAENRKAFIHPPSAADKSARRWANGAPLHLATPWNQTAPGDRLTAYMVARAVHTDRATGEQVEIARERFEQPVRILPSDRPVVGLITEEAPATAIAEHIRCHPLKVAIPSDPAAPPFDDTVVAYVFLEIKELPAPIAGLVSIRVGDREWLLGPMSSHEQWLVSTHGVMLPTILRVGADEMPDAVDAARAWIDAGRVDIIFRTDPAAALPAVDIHEIVPVDLVFRAVPVRDESPPRNRISMIAGAATIPPSTNPLSHAPAAPTGATYEQASPP